MDVATRPRRQFMGDFLKIAALPLLSSSLLAAGTKRAVAERQIKEILQTQVEIPFRKYNSNWLLRYRGIDIQMRTRSCRRALHR